LLSTYGYYISSVLYLQHLKRFILTFSLLFFGLGSAPNNKRQATSDKRQATSDKQQATSNKRQATSDKRQATRQGRARQNTLTLSPFSSFGFADSRGRMSGWGVRVVCVAGVISRTNFQNFYQKTFDIKRFLHI
jgi:hypothetical protein